jgi:hypothetical protein
MSRPCISPSAETKRRNSHCRRGLGAMAARWAGVSPRGGKSCRARCRVSHTAVDTRHAWARLTKASQSTTNVCASRAISTSIRTGLWANWELTAKWRMRSRIQSSGAKSWRGNGRWGSWWGVRRCHTACYQPRPCASATSRGRATNATQSVQLRPLRMNKTHLPICQFLQFVRAVILIAETKSPLWQKLRRLRHAHII